VARLTQHDHAVAVPRYDTWHTRINLLLARLGDAAAAKMAPNLVNACDVRITWLDGSPVTVVQEAGQ
jgi:hypothetical protein